MSPEPTVLTSTPDVMSGAIVFAGTRVPVHTLFEYLEAGETIDDFLEGFPTVTRHQVVQVLTAAEARLVEADA